MNEYLYQERTDKDVMVKMKHKKGLSVKVCHKSFRTLRRGMWLNNEIINHYMFMLNKCQDIFCKRNVERRRCHFLNTFFIEKIKPGSNVNEFEQTEKMRKKMTQPDIFKLDVLFIPVNIMNIHWCGVSVEFERKTVRVFDSWGHGCMDYAIMVFEYVKKVHNKIYNIPLPEQNSWKKICSAVEVPQQENSKNL